MTTDTLPEPDIFHLVTGDPLGYSIAVVDRLHRAAVAFETQRCLRIVRTYEVSVGNSRAGELACQMTMDNLREIAAEISSEAPGSRPPQSRQTASGGTV